MIFFIFLPKKFKLKLKRSLAGLPPVEGTLSQGSLHQPHSYGLKNPANKYGDAPPPEEPGKETLSYRSKF